MNTWPRPLPDYLTAETADRVAYGQLPWRQRLTTRPPAGWHGAWTARLVSRCVGRGGWGRLRTGAGTTAHRLVDLTAAAGYIAYSVATGLIVFLVGTAGWSPW